MASPKKLLASAAIAAGLLGGGVVGIVLGVPGVSGAQTTTVPDAPTTTAPAPDSGQTNPDRPPRGDGENCPDKAGAGAGRPAPGTGSGTGTGTGTGTQLRVSRGAGGRV